MAKLRINMDLDNGAFYDSAGRFLPQHEVAEILIGIAEDIRAGTVSARIFDSNGNRIGRWEIDEEM